ncbi:MAG: T9SS type A sorting domain-containing protein [Candidatus Cloacimonetes bacterium]|nr:T9SS type A sorting domain-containing protein [Candidatus Cloacimonadota bacterium]MBT4333953.1 T9SS type A sorting domain-containing protein [Candidatus Cloacimonadota bacterium]MBT4575642.1 T9SS type A sorting domain-containing protein [Candidatus Cloacimonadota bacterium]MBT5420613.1 T9SS type A sorting domain-containing protein [Candidatus Cloacimonadota bacterium]
MKHFIIMMLVLIFSLSLSAEIFIINTSQQNYEFDLVDIIDINFDDESLMLQTSEMTHTFLFEDILYMDFDTTTGIDPSEVPISSAFQLNQNYPNPFNPDTNISFSMDVTSKVEIDIYNAKGQKIRNLVDGFFSDGEHIVNWNGKTDEQKMAPSGIYFYRMSNNGIYRNRKMILMK